MIARILKIVLPLVVLAGAGGASAWLIMSKEEPKARPPEDRRPLVEVVSTAKTDTRLEVSVYGTVRPRTEIVVVPQVSGRVDHVSPTLREGGFFPKGEVLLKIDDRDYRLAVTQAKAGIAQAKAQLDRERAEAGIAKREWEKYGKGEPNDLVLRKPQVAQAEANLASAEATLESAKLSLERTVIEAPYAGRVRSRSVDLGQFVAVGTPVATIYATDFAEVRLAIPDDRVAFLDLPLTHSYAHPDTETDGGTGPEVRLVAVFGGEEVEWRGRIVRTAAELDPKTRVVYVVVRVRDPYGLESGSRTPLLIGTYVRGIIPGRASKDVVVLPGGALVDRDRVLVADDEDRIRFRTVKVLARRNDEVIVSGGLDAGERVIVTPIEFAVDGAKVRVAKGEGTDR
ncbi:MAG: efflux RND transporter periplasmic adaptor subunit [Planctomycetota bacterium]